MHKLLTHLLATIKAAAKANCKQLPFVDLVTKGKNNQRPQQQSPIESHCHTLYANKQTSQRLRQCTADTTWIQANSLLRMSARPPYLYSLLAAVEFSFFA